MLKHLTFLCLLFLFGQLSLFGLPSSKDSIYSSLPYIHFTEKDGLGSKTLYSIVQDKDGFVWIGTAAGAVRYDGKTFKRFTTEDGLTDNEVLRIYPDHSGRIWFMTLNGRLCFWSEGMIHNASNTSFLNHPYPSRLLLRTVFEDIKGRIFFGYENYGFIVIDGHSIQNIKLEKESHAASNHVLYQDETGEIWVPQSISSMRRLFEPDNKDSINIVIRGPFRVAYSKDNKTLYFNTVNGIYKVENHECKRLIDSTWIALKVVSNFAIEGDSMWICTSLGCFVFRDNTCINKYLEGVFITSFMRDRENNLWFTSLEKGIFMLPAGNSSMINYDQSSGLTDSKVISIYREKKGVVWLGYNNAKLDRISNGLKKSYTLPIPPNLNYCRITCMTGDSEVVWCGTDIGMYSIRNDVISYYPQKETSSVSPYYAVKRIFKDRYNNIYATTQGNVVKIARDEKGYNVRFMLPLSMRCFSGVETSPNKLLISTAVGLKEVVSGEAPADFKTNPDISDIRVMDMKYDYSHKLILATGGEGIYILKDHDVVQHLTKESGLPGNNCNKIFVSFNNVIVATSDGLAVLKEKNGKWFVSGTKTMKDGLPSNVTNDVIIDNNQFYVGTDEGMSVISVTGDKENFFVSNVMVTEVIADTIHFMSGEHYTLSSDIRSIIVKFAYTVFNPANEARIKYRLTDNHTNNQTWNFAKNNELEFFSLPPGQYIFQLAADIKSAPITSIYINIQPKWWQTSAAKVTFIGCVIGLIGLFIWRRTKNKYERNLVHIRQQHMLEMERNRIASDMHDDIGAELTKINMLANVALTSGDNSGVITKIVNKSTEVLNRMDHIIWTLNSFHDSLDDLIYFMHQQATRFFEDTKIDLSFTTEGEIPDIKIDSIKRRNISLVLKELAANSAKHSEASHVSIKIFFSDSMLNIIYQDNGKGYVISDTGRRNGRANMMNRIKEINAIADIKSQPGYGVNVNLKVLLL